MGRWTVAEHVAFDIGFALPQSPIKGLRRPFRRAAGNGRVDCEYLKLCGWKFQMTPIVVGTGPEGRVDPVCNTDPPPRQNKQNWQKERDSQKDLGGYWRPTLDALSAAATGQPRFRHRTLLRNSAGVQTRNAGSCPVFGRSKPCRQGWVWLRHKAQIQRR
jgi:hypothetical protein